MFRPPKPYRRYRSKRRGARNVAIAAAALVSLAAAVVLFASQAPTGTARMADPGPTEPSASGRAEPTPQAPAQPATAKPAPGPDITISAVGDVMMGDPTYGLPPAEGASLFAAVAELIPADVAIVNVEGTLSETGASKCGSGSANCFAFQTPPAYAGHLAEAGFSVGNLANNHSYDYGASGQKETIAALRRARVRPTGSPGLVAVQRAGRTRVAVLGFATYPWAESLLDIPRAARLVREWSERVDIVVVTFHGGAEGSNRTHVPPGAETYLGEQRGDLRAFSHAVVNAGADLVVGHGPHVLRGMEFHRGRLIAYSLGNFLGYEAFSVDGVLGTSAVLRVRLRADGRFAAARLRPVALDSSGVPAPGGAAISLIAGLSRDDFGPRAARVGRLGAILPPNARRARP